MDASPALEAIASEPASAPRGNQLWHSHSAPLRVPRGPQPPAPYLDVLSLQPRRLLSQTQAQIAAHEAAEGSKYSLQKGDASVSEAERLEGLLESVRLLLEPLQIPDLSHTGVFHSSTSQLQASSEQVSDSAAWNAAGGVKLSLSTIDKETDVKLFYPTGAKKSNMREYIKETLQRHLASEAASATASATASCGDLPAYTPGQASDHQQPTSTSKRLGASASVPVFASQAEASPSPMKSATMKSATRKPATKSPSPSLKHKKPKAAVSPKTSCGSPLLNPELTRQAKDIIAAIRANSSKINELIGS